MFSKTRSAGTAGAARTLRSVSSRGAAKVGTDAEDKLWEALHAYPNSTAADLASVAGIGKSTAGKILARWDKDGSVTRTPGIAEGGRRAADLWSVTDTAIDSAVEAAVDSDPANHTVARDADTADTERADAADPEATDPETTDDVETADEGSAEDGSAGPTDPAPTDHVLEATGTAATDPPAAEASESPAADGVTTDAHTAAEGGEGKSARLVPGALRGMVEDYLRDHPEGEFGPAAIARALGGKSSGAVSNALDKLTAEGTVVKTRDKPRRFALAPAEQATTASTAPQ
jgi:hypothetical protein